MQQNLELIGVATSADENNPLAVSGTGSLFTHDGAGHRVTINKQSEADTASQLFQTNWSGRAEIGLTGDDNLHVKVSPDGQAWVDAIRVDRTTGYVGINAELTKRLRVSGGAVQIGRNLISAEELGGGAAMEVMSEAVGDRNAYFDFHACDEHTDYASRFIRWQGEDGGFSIYNKGVGGIELNCLNAGFVRLVTDGTERMRVAADGKIGIGTSIPSTELHVEGTMRLKPQTLASLPSASGVGEGAVAYVSDKPGGGGLMTSDGNTWL